MVGVLNKISAVGGRSVASQIQKLISLRQAQRWSVESSGVQAVWCRVAFDRGAIRLLAAIVAVVAGGW
jgi:hypothetical protein